DAVGVRGIRLREGDYAVGGARARPNGALLTVTENGYGKRTLIGEYLRGSEGEAEDPAANAEAGLYARQPQKRGGYGLMNYCITEKTGKVAAVKVVDEDDDIMVISDDGTIIRMAAGDINLYRRATQGVILMRVTEGAKVISIARTEREEEEGEEAEEQASGQAGEQSPDPEP
ncbi:MAG: DNA gyrase C-terminal beta-propeller domain-containing protein, partial [Oscillospiraceae bacterium]|nr:DNA gyrase C-terminal beta-propeller domain-containing protein [Oscillospiraceae bacterium]